MTAGDVGEWMSVVAHGVEDEDPYAHLVWRSCLEFKALHRPLAHVVYDRWIVGSYELDAKTLTITGYANGKQIRVSLEDPNSFYKLAHAAKP